MHLEKVGLPRSSSSYVLKRKVHAPQLKRSKSATDWREEGNQSYKNSCAEGLSPVLQKHRLTTALECYKQSLDACDNDNEKSSVYKNIAVASKKYACILSEQNDRQKYFKQSLRNYMLATSISGSKTKEWIDLLNVTLQETITKLIDEVLTLSIDCKSKAELLHSYLSIIRQSVARAPFLHQLIQLRFDMGSEAFNNKQYEICFQEMGECKRLLEDLKCCDGNLESDHSMLLEEVDIFIKVSESINYRVAGCLFLILTSLSPLLSSIRTFTSLTLFLLGGGGIPPPLVNFIR